MGANTNIRFGHKVGEHNGSDRISQQLIHGPVLVGDRTNGGPEKVRFTKQTELGFKIAEVRKLLRTDLSLEAIANKLGVSDQMLVTFIRRRNLCDLKERRLFISRKRATAGEFDEKGNPIHGEDGAKI